MLGQRALYPHEISYNTAAKALTNNNPLAAAQHFYSAWQQGNIFAAQLFSAKRALPLLATQCQLPPDSSEMTIPDRLSLAMCYMLGIGTECDDARASAMLKTLAETNRIAQTLLVFLSRNRPYQLPGFAEEKSAQTQISGDVTESYSALVNRGHGEAMWRLGKVFLNQEDLTEEKFNEAVTLFTQAAEQGCPEGALLLAELHHRVVFGLAFGHLHLHNFGSPYAVRRWLGVAARLMREGKIDPQTVARNADSAFRSERLPIVEKLANLLVVGSETFLEELESIFDEQYQENRRYRLSCYGDELFQLLYGELTEPPALRVSNRETFLQLCKILVPGNRLFDQFFTQRQQALWIVRNFLNSIEQPFSAIPDFYRSESQSADQEQLLSQVLEMSFEHWEVLALSDRSEFQMLATHVLSQLMVKINNNADSVVVTNLQKYLYPFVVFAELLSAEDKRLLLVLLAQCSKTDETAINFLRENEALYLKVNTILADQAQEKTEEKSDALVSRDRWIAHKAAEEKASQIPTYPHETWYAEGIREIESGNILAGMKLLEQAALAGNLDAIVFSESTAGEDFFRQKIEETGFEDICVTDLSFEDRYYFGWTLITSGVDFDRGRVIWSELRQALLLSGKHKDLLVFMQFRLLDGVSGWFKIASKERNEIHQSMQLAAEAGYEFAQYYLAKIFYSKKLSESVGILFDKQKSENLAESWLRRAITEHKSGAAFFMMGSYYIGLSTDPDHSTHPRAMTIEECKNAIFYSVKAAEMGYFAVLNQLISLYQEGRFPATILESDLQVIACYQPSAARGDLRALIKLAKMFRDGRCLGGKTEQNRQRAIALYLQALEKESAEAINTLYEMLSLREQNSLFFWFFGVKATLVDSNLSLEDADQIYFKCENEFKEFATPRLIFINLLMRPPEDGSAPFFRRRPPLENISMDVLTSILEKAFEKKEDIVSVICAELMYPFRLSNQSTLESLWDCFNPDIEHSFFDRLSSVDKTRLLAAKMIHLSGVSPTQSGRHRTSLQAALRKMSTSNIRQLLPLYTKCTREGWRALSESDQSAFNTAIAIVLTSALTKPDFDNSALKCFLSDMIGLCHAMVPENKDLFVKVLLSLHGATDDAKQQLGELCDTPQIYQLFVAAVLVETNPLDDALSLEPTVTNSVKFNIDYAALLESVETKAKRREDVITKQTTALLETQADIEKRTQAKKHSEEEKRTARAACLISEVEKDQLTASLMKLKARIEDPKFSVCFRGEYICHQKDGQTVRKKVPSQVANIYNRITEILNARQQAITPELEEKIIKICDIGRQKMQARHSSCFPRLFKNPLATRVYEKAEFLENEIPSSAFGG